MSLVIMSRYDFPYEAYLAKEVLMREGISAFITDQHIVGAIWHYTIALGGVKLWVDETDVRNAQKVLAKDYSQELNEELTQNGEDPVSEADSKPRKRNYWAAALLSIRVFC